MRPSAPTDASVELALPWSSAAKRLVHDLIGPRRIDVAAEGRLILVRHGERCQQTLEGREILIVHGCRDRLLHQMVARESRSPWLMRATSSGVSYLNLVSGVPFFSAR